MHSSLRVQLLLLLLWNLTVLIHGQNNLFSGFRKNKDGMLEDVPLTTKLSNDREIPLVGMGVGNLGHNRIEHMIYEGLKSENQIRLIDTAHASMNEKLVAKGFVSGVQRLVQEDPKNNNDARIQVHVVTKIWYTYLGYERTKISVQESLEDLSEAIRDPRVDLKVHFLLHWPRCYDTISWMNCEEEEENLPVHVKKAGSPPHLDKERAWKESWRALEDMYNNGDYSSLIASIGVSNFNNKDMEALLDVARVMPHLTQINVWSLIFDQDLVELCNRGNIHIQVYNVMNGIVGNAFKMPHAHHHLLAVANALHHPSEAVTGAQVILKWLVQFDMAIIPRTSDSGRLHENSAMALSQISNMTEPQLQAVTSIAEAMLDGQDMEEDVFVTVTFTATNEDMFVYFLPNEDSLQQIAYIEKGDSFQDKSHPHHKFRIFHATNPDRYHDYQVQGKYGDHVEVNVEL